jgi:hypothetical protein
MSVNTVLTILSSSHQTDEELAVSLVKLTRGLPAKCLEDALAIALGVGKLNHQTAQNLILILEQIGSLDDSKEDGTLEEPEFAVIKAEIEQLLERRQQLLDRQHLISELQSSVLKLERARDEAKLKKRQLSDELAEIQQQLDLLDEIESESQ